MVIVHYRNMRLEVINNYDGGLVKGSNSNLSCFQAKGWKSKERVSQG